MTVARAAAPAAKPEPQATQLRPPPARHAPTHAQQLRPRPVRAALDPAPPAATPALDLALALVLMLAAKPRLTLTLDAMPLDPPPKLHRAPMVHDLAAGKRLDRSSLAAGST